MDHVPTKHYKLPDSFYTPISSAPIMKFTNTCAMVSALGASAFATPLQGSDKIFAVAPLGAGDALFTKPINETEAFFIGGKAVPHKEYPFMAAGHRAGGPRPNGQSCSGSVIAPRKVVIAAHCADASGTKTVVYGSDDVGKGEPKKLEVLSYKKHPKYSNFQQGYDVAVITTKEDIVPADFKFPKFATSKDAGKVKFGTEAFALGYGKKDVDDKQKNAELHRAEFPVVDPAECDKTGQGLKVVPEQQFCIGTPTGRPTTCLQGDSGGPMIVDGVIYGICSWSKSTWDWYSIYNRLDNEVGDWVAEELKK
ncbi:hypothetical protein VHEMI02441 [[Torrubiella] hemipterigena]|uniref:Peptidase S1 domain-containing protein n=1 Tax=[Torrubiella] hemipterigena TaxID=1531966 RepID=A0A0A1T7W1_9HYPO|nr:hypothetical protein VHEMI02441 [[Torrubiella] hemipterigena]